MKAFFTLINRINQSKRIIPPILIVLVLSGFIFGDFKFSSYKGSDSDEKKIVNYIQKHIDTYFIDIDTLSSAQERREVVKLRKELESLVMKIDVGDIKNKKFRAKCLSLRRNAAKKNNSESFVVHNFERLTRGGLGGRVMAEFDGVVNRVSPWISFTLEKNETQAFKKVLRCDYDVREGSAQVYMPVTKHAPFKRYGAIAFNVKSNDTKSLIIRIESESFHEYVVSGITSEWQYVRIPFEEMTNFKAFNKKKIKRIDFIVNDQIVENLIGTLYLDDILLVRHMNPALLIKPVEVQTYEVEGSVPLGTDKSIYIRKE